MKVVRTDTVKGDEADLIEDIEVVQVAFMKDELEKEGRRIYIDRFKLSSLEA